jgi:vitamin B12 transporter
MNAAITLAAVLLALPAAAGAQQPTDTVELAPVVITPTRQPSGLGRVTQATTVITGEELRTRGITFVADALRDIPGAAVVQVGSFGGVTSLFLRGGNSNYVKVLVDGVPVNQAGGAYDFADLTTSNVDRIEIVRGPASVVYGSDAVTGVIQIFTRRGGAARGSVTTAAGTYGATLVDATAASGGRRVSASGGFQRLDSDGTYRFNSHYRNATVDGRIDVAPDTLTDAAFTARYIDRSYRFPTDGSGAATDSNQVTNGDQVTLGLDAGRRVSRVVQARLALALHAGRDAFDDQPDGPADTTGFAFASTRRSSAWRRSVDARMIVTPRRGLTVAAGAQFEGEHEQQTSSTISDFGFGREVAPDSFDRSRTTGAAYLLAAAALAHGVALDAGARLDDNSAFGTFVTGRGGIAVQLAATKLRVSAGNAFKAPTFSENFASSPFEVGNPALRPERTVSWDAGIEQLLPGRRASVSATWFDQRFQNLIQYTPADPGNPTYANLAAATARGLELAGRVWWGTGSLSAQYTWLRTRVTDAGVGSSPVFLAGSTLIRRPAHSARVGLELRPGSRVRTFADVVVIGRRDDVDFRPFPAERVTLPAVATVELAGDIDLAEARGGHPGLGLRIRIENLLGKDYETIVGFPGRRRSLLVGVRAGL